MSVAEDHQYADWVQCSFCPGGMAECRGPACPDRLRRQLAERTGELLGGIREAASNLKAEAHVRLDRIRVDESRGTRSPGGRMQQFDSAHDREEGDYQLTVSLWISPQQAADLEAAGVIQPVNEDKELRIQAAEVAIDGITWKGALTKADLDAQMQELQRLPPAPPLTGTVEHALQVIENALRYGVNDPEAYVSAHLPMGMLVEAVVYGTTARCPECSDMKPVYGLRCSFGPKPESIKGYKCRTCDHVWSAIVAGVQVDEQPPHGHNARCDLLIADDVLLDHHNARCDIGALSDVLKSPSKALPQEVADAINQTYDGVSATVEDGVVVVGELKHDTDLLPAAHGDGTWKEEDDES